MNNASLMLVTITIATAVATSVVVADVKNNINLALLQCQQFIFL